MKTIKITFFTLVAVWWARIAVIIILSLTSCNTTGRPDDAIDIACAQNIVIPSGPPLKAK